MSLPDSKIPSGPMAEKWSKHKFDSKLINPNNKRKYTVLFGLVTHEVPAP